MGSGLRSSKGVPPDDGDRIAFRQAAAARPVAAGARAHCPRRHGRPGPGRARTPRPTCSDRATSSTRTSREGFPKIAAYRPGCSVAAAKLAAFDWVVASGNCAARLDGAHARNRSLLGMIQPAGPDQLFAATYGQYDQITSPLGRPATGAIRPFRSSDWLHNTDGSVHRDGHGERAEPALDRHGTVVGRRGRLLGETERRAQPAAPRRDGRAGGTTTSGRTRPTPSPARRSTRTPSARRPRPRNQATWDANFVARHDRLARDLPGMVIGGNDLVLVRVQPGRLQGRSRQRLAAARYLQRRDAGVRRQVPRPLQSVGSRRADHAAQRFLAGKKLDGKQRYLMLNNCNATSTQINEYSLAVATIGGFYYWPYTQSGWWDSTMRSRPSIADYTHNGTRHWLGFPTAAPRKLAVGALEAHVPARRRLREHDRRDPDRRRPHAGNQTGLFVSSDSRRVGVAALQPSSISAPRS